MRQPDGGASGLTLGHLAAGAFTAVLPLPDGAGEGTWQLALAPYAGLDAGVLAFELDRTPPTFTAAVEAAPARGGDGGLVLADPALGGAGAFRRDEDFHVAVSFAATDVGDAGVRVTVQGLLLDAGLAPASSAGVSEVAGGCRASCGAGTCRCFRVDAARPLHDAVRGQWAVQAEVTDTAGNTSGPRAAGGAWVTRWKWMRVAFSSSAESAPALDGQGALYFGHGAGVASLTPEGDVRWSVALGNVRSAVAVGRRDGGEEVLFAANASGGFFGLAAADGGTWDLFPSNSAVSFGAAPALLTTSAAGESALTGATFLREVLVGSPQLLALRARAANQSQSWGDVAGDPGWPANAVALDGGVTVVNLAGDLSGLAFDDAAWQVAATASSGVGAATAVSVDLPSGRFLVSGTSVRSVPLSFAAGASAISGGSAWGPVVVSAPGVWWAGSNTNGGQLDRFGPSAAPASVPLAAPLASAPIVGASGLVYLAASNGDVEARAEADLSLHWRLPLSEPVAASPALDVSRDGAGAKLCGRPGVLYVLATSGKLYALVADSAGVEPGAPWPKYQRDGRNSGNVAWPTGEFTCP